MPCLIIMFLFATLSKSYGVCLSLKSDTGKGVSASPSKSILLQQKLSSIADISSSPLFADVQLTRIGWANGALNGVLNFNRYDLAKIVPMGFEALAATDREHFTITISQDSIKEAKDTLCAYDGKLHRGIYIFVPVVLSNKSADTLKYVNMVCSRLDIFRTDKQNMQLLLLTTNCYKNGPQVFKVAPHQQTTFNIPICFLTDMDDSKPFTAKNFRIGMSLFKYIEGNMFPFNMYSLAHSAKSDNVIWSNEVVMR